MVKTRELPRGIDVRPTDPVFRVPVPRLAPKSFQIPDFQPFAKWDLPGGRSISLGLWNLGDPLFIPEIYQYESNCVIYTEFRLAGAPRVKIGRLNKACVKDKRPPIDFDFSHPFWQWVFKQPGALITLYMGYCEIWKIPKQVFNYPYYDRHEFNYPAWLPDARTGLEAYGITDGNEYLEYVSDTGQTTYLIDGGFPIPGDAYWGGFFGCWNIAESDNFPNLIGTRICSWSWQRFLDEDKPYVEQFGIRTVSMDFTVEHHLEDMFRWVNTQRENLWFDAAWSVRIPPGAETPPPIPAPPPVNPPNKECCMCCPQTNQNDDLLRLIYQKLGGKELPASVPTLLSKPDSGTTQIQNLAHLVSWSARQLDALVGKYPLEIQIEDTDATQAGNQEQTLKFPNQSELLGEIVLILCALRSESNIILQASLKAMIEAGMAKKAATIANDYAQANAEYLGYKGEFVEREMPLLFSPGKERFDEILKEGIIKIKGWENKDNRDIKDEFAPLLDMAAKWHAQNFRNTGTANTTSRILDLLKTGGDTAKIMKELFNTQQPQEGENSGERPPNEWDIFLEETEQGFINQPGITDNLKPYGRPLERRPKIREIGTDTSDTNDNNQS